MNPYYPVIHKLFMKHRRNRVRPIKTLYTYLFNTLPNAKGYRYITTLEHFDYIKITDGGLFSDPRIIVYIPFDINDKTKWKDGSLLNDFLNEYLPSDTTELEKILLKLTLEK